MNGDWLSGVSVVDNVHLGSQEGLPYQILREKARNKFYLLPLILGIIVIYMYNKNKQYTLIFGLLFFVTGIALIIYMNQPPRELRERDYGSVGSSLPSVSGSVLLL